MRRLHFSAPRSQQAGFGIVELMIGMALGLLIIGGAVGLYVQSQQSYRTNDALGRVQENMRSSFEIMAKELRQAGGTVCGARQVANVLKDSGTSWSSNWDGGTFIGYKAGTDAPGVTTGTGTAERLSSTDALQILSGTLGPSVAITAQDATTYTMTLQSAAGLSAGDFVIACDGATAAIFQIASVTGNVISYAKDTGTPGNCSTNLGFPTVCAGGSSKLFTTNGYVTPLTASTWYVGKNGRGGNSLFRKTAKTTEEIAEGVTTMQASFLTRNKATQNLGSDWVDSSSITNWTEAATSDVVAVRVTIGLETLANVGTNSQAIGREAIFVANLRSRAQ